MLVCNILLLSLIVLLLLGYFTLLERKVLGYGQLRKGPNKGVLWGLVQPLLDGVKLFTKGVTILWFNSTSLVLICGSCGLSLVLALWWVNLGLIGGWGVVYGLLLVLIVVGLVGVLYFVVGLMGGSNYSGYGSIRSLAMVVTYEGVMFFCLVGLFWGQMSLTSNIGVYSVVGGCLLVLLLVSMVMESSRTPVDFVEGESELVSGLTTEMGSITFSLLFLLEYGLMGVFACIWVFVWLGVGPTMSGIAGVLSVVLMCLFNWLRMALPRSRFDLVMEWGWKFLLVISFSLVLVFMGMSVVCVSN